MADQEKTAPPPPVHFYDRDADGRLTRIACGTKVTYSHFATYTTDPLKCSCRKCSKEAKAMTDAQREEAWQNANDRLDSDAVSPWWRAKKKAERLAAKKARAEEKAAAAAKRKALAGGMPF